MTLPVTELRAFVTLAEHLHFSRTADVLHITQPALTKQIQRLEEIVGGALVIRGYREVRLSQAGQVLLPRARLVLQESDAALEAARKAARGELGMLRIGFGLATIQKLLPDALLRFRSRSPGVELRMKDMSTPGQLAALVRGEIDVGFVRLPVADSRIATRPILHERLVAVLGARSPWRARDGLRSIAQEPFVTLSRATSASFHDHVVALCHAAGFTPNIVQETNELFTMMMLVRAGMGVAVAPTAAVFRRPSGVRIRTIAQPEAAWDIGLAWDKERSEEPLLRAFVELTLSFYRPPARRG